MTRRRGRADLVCLTGLEMCYLTTLEFVFVSVVKAQVRCLSCALRRECAPGAVKALMAVWHV